jgi:aspartate kinase
MALRVQKYGGTSVENVARIVEVARRVAAAKRSGDDLVVVVSAMGQQTDELMRLAGEVSKRPSRRELDMLITSGERVSMALLAMALHDLGIEAISFTGSQSGILTDGTHNSARIREVRPDRIRAELTHGRVVIVAGFQGVNPETREITTLGRGGSDTTAVALAAALGAGRCEVYKDVPGVMTADPRVVATAQVIPRLAYRLCSALAHLGGQILHARCVDMAAVHRVTLIVGSSFKEDAGTTIEGSDMESGKVEAIAQQANRSIAIAEGNSGARGEARGIITDVAARYPSIELLAHEQAGGVHDALVWTGEREAIESLVAGFRELRGPGGEWSISAQHDSAFISAVGIGLGAADIVRAEAALERAHVTLIAMRVAPTALIFRVAAAQGDDAARALHGEFLPS